ncbi:Uncharacterised protein [Klebsiella pneumoniae]|nr:Uncharacterised protein [Klebsiella pneumoniae]
MCGGYRYFIDWLDISQEYSPRVRGLSVQRHLLSRVTVVFPPCAGVIGATFPDYMAGTCIPPVCGGYRWCSQPSPAGWKYSPRVRGLSVVLSTVTRWLEVFPPCAGVIGRVVHGYPLAGSIPPACGGYRRYLTSSRKAQTYSPRMRGLSGTLTDTFCTVLVFPPHAGVIALEKQKPHRGRGIPPVCGGYRLLFGSW